MSIQSGTQTFPAAGGRWIAEMSWPAAARALGEGHVLLAPIGAAAKAHGPHLPLGTDRIVVEALAERVAARTGALIAPTTTLGYYPAFVEYPVSQHIGADLFQALLEASLRRFVDSGATRIVILNNGVSTEGPVVVAGHTIYAETGVRPAIAQLRLFGRGADSELADPSGGHADERETSAMLALRPDLVDMAAAAAAPPETSQSEASPSGDRPRLARPVRLAHGRPPGPGEASAAGATGDPRGATATKGHAILAATVEDLVAEVARVFPDAPGGAHPS